MEKIYNVILPDNLSKNISMRHNLHTLHMSFIQTGYIKLNKNYFVVIACSRGT